MTVALIRYIGITGFLVLVALYIFMGGREFSTVVLDNSTIAVEENDSRRMDIATSSIEVKKITPLADRQDKILATTKSTPVQESLPSIISLTELPPASKSRERPSLQESDTLKEIQQGIKGIETALEEVLELPPLIQLPELPPLNQDAIQNAVVKIECATASGLGKYIGSGFVVDRGRVMTAAHVVIDSGVDTCSIIFPKDRIPIHYLSATIIDIEEARRRHDEEGIDIVILQLPDISGYSDALNIFNSYPEVPYQVCIEPSSLGDAMLHFGYPANYADNSYLAVTKGEVVAFGTIDGVGEQLSENQTYSYKTPILTFDYDEEIFHPYMLSRVSSFYGDSGGLAFNTTKQCIVGPHRAATVGGGPDENYSLFMDMGWEPLGELLLQEN